MRKDKIFLHIFLTSLAVLPCTQLLSSCSFHEGSESQLKEDVDSFATYYYNWHFKKALKYCTPESEKWLRYASSNVHQADLELLHQKDEDATIDIDDIDFQDENTAIVSLSIHNFLQMDTIGKAAHLIEDATFQIPMIIHDGKWKVKMEGLPQSGTQSHDSTSDEQ